MGELRGRLAQAWGVSAVEFADRELGEIWYRNQYSLARCLKPSTIGTAWHGDYHMNYNTQQVQWGAFSSNHVEQHEPYMRPGVWTENLSLPAALDEYLLQSYNGVVRLFPTRRI